MDNYIINYLFTFIFLVFELNFYRRFPVNGAHRVHPIDKRRQRTKWNPPDSQWIKINFDKATRGNPGRSRVGCISRDHKGTILQLQ